MNEAERKIVESLRGEPCGTRLWWAFLRGDLSYAAWCEAVRT
jgi:hypothetical protein